MSAENIKKLFSLNLKKFFDVDQEQVFSRLLRSLLPNPAKNFIHDYLQPLPDLYGPFWIGVTLIFSTAISGNLVHYIESSNIGGKNEYQTDFTLVTGATSLIFSYILLVPFILYWTFWYRRLETQYSYLELLSAYGYSLTIFIPVSMLWIIHFYWFRWALIGVAVAVGWFVLFNIVWTAVKSDSNGFAALLIIATVLLLHAGLGLGFKTYYFDSVIPSDRGILSTAPPPQLIKGDPKAEMLIASTATAQPEEKKTREMELKAAYDMVLQHMLRQAVLANGTVAERNDMEILGIDFQPAFDLLSHPNLTFYQRLIETKPFEAATADQNGSVRHDLLSSPVNATIAAIQKEEGKKTAAADAMDSKNFTTLPSTTTTRAKEEEAERKHGI